MSPVFPCCSLRQAKPHIFASVSDAQRLNLWDASARDLLRTASVGFAAKAVAISPVPLLGASGKAAHHVAVGGKGGRLRILVRGRRRLPCPPTRAQPLSGFLPTHAGRAAVSRASSETSSPPVIPRCVVNSLI